MAEKYPEFLTESFEQVVTNFYNAARAANPDNPHSDKKAGDDPKQNTVDVVATVSAIVHKFRNSSESSNEKDAFASIDELAAKTEAISLQTKAEVPSNDEFTDQIKAVVAATCPKEYLCLQESAERSCMSLTKTSNEHSSSVIGRDQDNLATGNQLVFHTQNPSHTIGFEWSLKNFSSYEDNVSSQDFNCNGCRKTWQVTLRMTNIMHCSAEYIEFLVKSKSKGNIHGSFDFRIYNSRTDIYGHWVTEADFNDGYREHVCFKALRPGTLLGKAGTINFKLIDDELIIKGCIVFQGCCVSTRRLKEPRLNTKA